jgi:hypothetical protein
MYHQKLRGIEGIFSLCPSSSLVGLEMSANLRIQGRVQDVPEGSILLFSFHPKEMRQVHKLGTQKHVFAIALELGERTLDQTLFEAIPVSIFGSLLNTHTA